MKKILLFFAVLLISNIAVSAISVENYQNDAVEYRYQIFILIYDNKDYKAALNKANEAIKKFPNVAELYVSRGDVCSNLNSYKSALANYNKAISLNPNLVEAYASRGLLKLDKMNSPHGAYIDFTTCLRLDSVNSTCRLGRSAAMLELGDMSGGLNELQASIDDFEKERVETEEFFRETEELLKK